MNIIGADLDYDKLSPYFLKGARIYNGTLSMFGTFDMNNTISETVKKDRVKAIKKEEHPVKNGHVDNVSE